MMQDVSMLEFGKLTMMKNTISGQKSFNVAAFTVNFNYLFLLIRRCLY